MTQRGDCSIFHAFYRELVQALYDVGTSRSVFCGNVDAVAPALLLALPWKDYRDGTLGERELETTAFTVFLYGRMIDSAAVIDDHLKRGRNMDTRTPAATCSYVVQGPGRACLRSPSRRSRAGRARLPCRHEHAAR